MKLNLKKHIIREDDIVTQKVDFVICISNIQTRAKYM